MKRMNGTLNSFLSCADAGFSRVGWLSPAKMSESVVEGEKRKALNAHPFCYTVNEVSRSLK
jgi:hypothetical protein